MEQSHKNVEQILDSNKSLMIDENRRIRGLLYKYLYLLCTELHYTLKIRNVFKINSPQNSLKFRSVLARLLAIYEYIESSMTFEIFFY